MAASAGLLQTLPWSGCDENHPQLAPTCSNPQSHVCGTVLSSVCFVQALFIVLRDDWWTKPKATSSCTSSTSQNMRCGKVRRLRLDLGAVVQNPARAAIAHTKSCGRTWSCSARAASPKFMGTFLRGCKEVPVSPKLSICTMSRHYGERRLGAIAAKVISDSERPWVHRLGQVLA